MPPPIRAFPSSALPSEVQNDANGRRRKHAPGTPAEIDLRACELFEMSQFECGVVNPEDRGSPLRCVQLLRFFRKYVFALLIFWIWFSFENACYFILFLGSGRSCGGRGG